MRTKTGFVVVPHKPTDKMDVPFRIKGMKLRWIAPHQTEERMGGTWRVLRKTDLPEEALKRLNEINSFVFSNGDSVRYKELVLGWVSDEQAASMKKENQEAAKAQMDTVRKKTSPGNGVKVTEATFSKGPDKEFFNNLP